MPESRKSAAFWPLLVLAMSLAITWGWRIALQRSVERALAVELAAEADEISAAISQRFILQESKLHGAAGLFSASQAVTRREWETWTERQDLSRVLPGVLSVCFARRVPAGGARELEESVRAEGFPDFRIFPEAAGESYPVVYLHPFTGANLGSFGFDLASEERRRAMLERAIETGAAAVSRCVQLVRDRGQAPKPALLLAVATYRGEAVPPSLEARRAAATGAVYMSLRASDLMAGIFGGKRTRSSYVLRDGDELLYAEYPDHDELKARSARADVRQVDVAGRQWTLETVLRPNDESRRLAGMPDAATAAGAAISVLLAVIAGFLSVGKRRATALAEAATADFAAANRDLRESVRVLEHRMRQITLLNETAEVLQTCRDEQEAARALRNACERMFPACRGAFYFAGDTPEGMAAAEAWGGMDAPAIRQRHECWALRKGRPHLGEAAASMQCAHLAGGRTTVCVPLTAAGALYGLLVLEESAPHDAAQSLASAHQRQLAITVAEQAALGMANARLRRELEDLSIRDPLTRLHNRRYLGKFLEDALRDGAAETVAVAIMDLDHFKKFNDSHGHLAGDALLKAAAGCIKSGAPTNACAARFGGEEFVLVLPKLDAETAAVIAERLRAAIAALRVPVSRGKAGTTVSIGIAAYPDHASTADDLLARADKELYKAKEAGRDRVSVAGN